jgi:hypothetical protein
MWEHTSFAFFQHTIIPLIIREWVSSTVANEDHKVQQWSQWLHDINEQSTFEDVLSRTNLFDLWEYMNKVNKCHAVRSNILLL